jgi:hypothetical protein
MIKIVKYTTYAPDTDIQFIMIDTYNGDNKIISTECAGWYYGKENLHDTISFTGKLKATFKGGI